jgi:hypothetical protein
LVRIDSHEVRVMRLTTAVTEELSEIDLAIDRMHALLMLERCVAGWWFLVGATTPREHQRTHAADDT